VTPVQKTVSALAGILGRRVRETPIAVIDFETTGMRPGVDRVVEAAVVRIDPGQAPRLVFDSLINPGRPMDCTQIHGITDAHVSGAPTFDDVAGDFLTAIEGCVVAAYNVAFDSKFLHFELASAGCRQNGMTVAAAFNGRGVSSYHLDSVNSDEV
jgi:DNA polymerase-3 subunit epsilon